jgi:hypothetical protein
MGFKKPNIESAYSAIRSSIVEISSPYNDGWTSSTCKQELYQLKCWLEDEYNKLPTFADEEKWEQERIIQVLKK